jgi:hypothetical protein
MTREESIKEAKEYQYLIGKKFKGNQNNIICTVENIDGHTCLPNTNDNFVPFISLRIHDEIRTPIIEQLSFFLANYSPIS